MYVLYIFYWVYGAYSYSSHFSRALSSNRCHVITINSTLGLLMSIHMCTHPSSGTNQFKDLSDVLIYTMSVVF